MAHSNQTPPFISATQSTIAASVPASEIVVEAHPQHCASPEPARPDDKPTFCSLIRSAGYSGLWGMAGKHITDGQASGSQALASTPQSQQLQGCPQDGRSRSCGGHGTLRPLSRTSANRRHRQVEEKPCSPEKCPNEKERQLPERLGIENAGHYPSPRWKGTGTLSRSASTGLRLSFLFCFIPRTWPPTSSS